MSEFNYEDDLSINKFRLDEEWLAQPSLYWKYAKECVKAKKHWDVLWEKSKTRKAKLIKQIRTESPNAKNDVVDAYWRNDKKYQRYTQDKIQAEYEYNMLNKAEYAFTQRKMSLEQLVKLHLSEYYSEPIAKDSNSREYVNNVKKESTKDRIKKGIKKRKRRR